MKLDALHVHRDKLYLIKYKSYINLTRSSLSSTHVVDVLTNRFRCKKQTSVARAYQWLSVDIVDTLWTLCVAENSLLSEYRHPLKSAPIYSQ